MKKVFLASFAILAAALITANFAYAEDLSDERKNSISQNCVHAQSNLHRLSSSDTTTRINRGRDYDQALKLFYLMNTRVASNNIAEPKLAEITKEFEKELSTFRENYNSYNSQLKITVDFNCANEPQEFHNNLNNTREKRSNLNSSIIKLNNLIEDYQNAIKELVI